MYEYLEGTVASRSLSRLVLDVRGIGYDIAIPNGAPFASAGTVRVWTHFVVREDAHLLFGFADFATRELFRALLGVRGVGPSMALALLSGLSRDDLLAAIAAGDVARLEAVKGIGKKTANQILLDLGGQAAELASALGVGVESAQSVLKPRKAQKLVEDAVVALISIGYAENEARKAVERAQKKVRGNDLELLVRTAIRS